MQVWNERQKQVFTWVVYFIVPLSGVCVDVYVPSLPHMALALGVSQAWVQMTLPVYSIGMALGQFFVGPLADTTGRRPLIMTGVVLQLLWVFLITVSSSMTCILILRALQGVCLSLIIVPARIVFSDLFTGKEFDKKISFMGAFWALGSIVAPVIGGYLQYYFNWHAPFYFMAGYDAIILVTVYFLLHETSVITTSFSFNQVRAHYGVLVKHRLVLSTMVLGGGLVSFMLLFNIVAPFFVQHILGYSALEYGKVAFLIGVAWFVGTMISKQLVSVELIKKVRFSLLVILIFSIFTLIGGIIFPVSLSGIMLNAMLIVSAAGVVFPAVISRVMQLPLGMPGTVSSFLFSGMWVVGAVITSFGALLKTHSIVPLYVVYVALSLFLILVFYRVYRLAIKTQREYAVRAASITDKTLVFDC